MTQPARRKRKADRPAAQDEAEPRPTDVPGAHQNQDDGYRYTGNQEPERSRTPNANKKG